MLITRITTHGTKTGKMTITELKTRQADWPTTEQKASRTQASHSQKWGVESHQDYPRYRKQHPGKMAFHFLFQG